MANHNNRLIQKWWFWLCLIIITIIICFTLIILNIKSGITGIAIQIQDIYPNATLYTSAGDNTLILELEHLSENDVNSSFDMLKPIKDNLTTELTTYSKLIIIGYIDIDNTERDEMVQVTYSLPDLQEISDQVYVDTNYLQTSFANSLTSILNY